MPEVYENFTVLQNVYSDENYYGNALMNSSTGIPSPYTSSPDSHRQTSMSSPMSVSSSPQYLSNIYVSLPEATVLDPPHITILEQPVEKFRFRYRSEMMGTHGSLVGANSTGSRKKHVPTVQLHNWPERAIIRCTLVTADTEKRMPHAHRLVKREGNYDQDDPHHVDVSAENGHIASFHGMGIIHTAKKHIKDELIRKMRVEALERCRRKNINATLTIREETQIRTDAEMYQKCMNLNSVALCFQGFALGSNDIMSPITDPVYSNTINNLKSALTGELRICRIDKYTSSCEGGEEVFILVEKVGKKNIKIKFFELNDDDNEIWVDYGLFNELDVHHQYAIVFRTPPYKDTNIKKPKEVYVQLERPSDGDFSEPIKFTYKPSDKIVSRKRPKISTSGSFDMTQVMSSFMSSTNGNQNMPSNTSQEFSSEIKKLLNEQPCPSAEFKDFVNNMNISEYELLMGKSEGALLNPLLTADGPMPKKNDMAFANNFVMEALKIIKTEPHRAKQRLQKMFKERTTYGDTPLHAALRHSQRELVKYILMIMATDPEYSQFVDIANSTGKTPLNYAVEQNEPDVVKALLLLGANPDEPDEHGLRPLHAAAKLPDGGACVDALLATNATSVDRRTDAGWTALQLAAESGSYHAVRSLIKAGADVNDVERTYGRTALHIAVAGGHIEIVDFLLRKTNINVNQRNYSGNTALHTAVVSQGVQAKEICKLLLKYGADPTIPNNDCETINEQRDSDEMEIKKEVESEDEDEDDKLMGKTSFDLASENPEILNVLCGIKEEPIEVDLAEFVPKEEILDDDDDTENRFLNAEQMEKLAVILNKTKGWKNLARQLEIDVLFDENVEANPSLFLLKYLNSQGDMTLERLRNLLEDIDETAVRFITDILTV